MSGRPCAECGETVYDWERSHRCNPRFVVWAPIYGQTADDGGQAFRVRDAEAAAEAWAERWDSNGDYEIIGGDEVLVHVRGADGELLRWTVAGETVPQYSAAREDDDEMDLGELKPCTQCGVQACDAETDEAGRCARCRAGIAPSELDDGPDEPESVEDGASLIGGAS